MQKSLEPERPRTKHLAAAFLHPERQSSLGVSSALGILGAAQCTKDPFNGQVVAIGGWGQGATGPAERQT